MDRETTAMVDAPPPEEEPDALREFSKVLFGSATRLPVMECIARLDRGERFSATSLAQELGITPPVARKELLHLQAAGLVELQGANQTGSTRSVRFSRVENDVWELAIGVAEDVRAREIVPSREGIRY